MAFHTCPMTLLSAFWNELPYGWLVHPGYLSSKTLLMFTSIKEVKMDPPNTENRTLGACLFISAGLAKMLVNINFATFCPIPGWNVKWPGELRLRGFLWKEY